MTRVVADQIAPQVVRDVMVTDVVTAEIDTPLARVIDDMVRGDISGLPVIDGERRVVGIVTDADVIARRGFDPIPHLPSPVFDEDARSHRNRWRQKVDGCTVGDVMSTPVETVGPDAPLRSATARMITMSNRSLPVVDASGRLVGIVSHRDILRVLHRTDNEIATAVRAVLADAPSAQAASPLAVAVADGAVTLTGSTSDPSRLLALLAVISQLPGVLEIHDAVTRRAAPPCDDPGGAPTGEPKPISTDHETRRR